MQTTCEGNNKRTSGKGYEEVTNLVLYIVYEYQEGKFNIAF